MIESVMNVDSLYLKVMSPQQMNLGQLASLGVHKIRKVVSEALDQSNVQIAVFPIDAAGIFLRLMAGLDFYAHVLFGRTVQRLRDDTLWTTPCICHAVCVEGGVVLPAATAFTYETNGFSAETEFLPRDQPLLVPIDCKCYGGFFQAVLVKTTAAGESFYGISESLEGLTTCKAIKEKNLGVSPSNLQPKIKLSVPVRCACPSSSEISSGTNLLVSYPVGKGDSISSLATLFNVTVEAILRASNRPGGGNVRQEKNIIQDSSSLLIPLNQKPLLASLARPRQPSSGFPKRTAQSAAKRKKKAKMMKVGICVAVISVAVGASVGAAIVVFIVQRKRKTQRCLSSKMVDVELQQLSLSVRTTSEKKVSFEGSQSTLDGQVIEATTPHNKMMLENYTFDELKKATEDFNSHNLIEGSVYHGRLKGKNLAIKCTSSEYISKVDFSLFQDTIHNHPNIIRVLGSCPTDGPDSYLVFEYAKNGSLKDWIHGGLAMKSHFIASCNCFLTWKQRLRICLDVALAVQYMHQIMHPVYVHRNIKSKNIFLDEEFNAKIGNFGMSRCVEGDTEEETQFCSRNPSSWSKGYLAPEYVKQGIVSPSVDIFAYGVVILEVLSGETPVMISDESEGDIVLLSHKIKSILESENSDDLRGWMDADLSENYPFDGAVALVDLARACVEDDPSLRPTAGEIVEKLSRVVEESPAGDQQFLINESSSKPLVQAVASNDV